MNLLRLSSACLCAGMLLAGCTVQGQLSNAATDLTNADSRSVKTLLSVGAAEATFVCGPAAAGQRYAWQYHGTSAFLSDAQGRRLGFVQLAPMSVDHTGTLLTGQPDHRLQAMAPRGALGAMGFTHALRQAADGLVPPRVSCSVDSAGRIEVRPYRAQFLLVRSA
jgi:hypothetical protein